MSYPPVSPHNDRSEALSPAHGVPEVEQSDFKPLTREQAQKWRASQPQMSVWQVVKWQLVLTALVTLGAGLLMRQASVTWSVLYGAMCILLPTAVMAYGLTSSALARWLRSSRSRAGGGSLAGVFVWEGVKVVLALLMLWTAPRWLPEVNWIGLLVGLVVVLKAYWLVLWQPGRT